MSENDATQTNAELMTIKDVAALLQVSTKQVRRLIENGELTHYRIGRLYRVAPDDLKAFLGHCQIKILGIFQSLNGCGNSQVSCAVRGPPRITFST